MQEVYCKHKKLLCLLSILLCYNSGIFNGASHVNAVIVPVEDEVVLASWSLVKWQIDNTTIKLHSVTLKPVDPQQAYDMRLTVAQVLIRHSGLEFVLRDLQWDIRFDARQQQVQIQQTIKSLLLPQLFAQGQNARLNQTMQIKLAPVQDWTPTMTLAGLLNQIKTIQIRNFILHKGNARLYGQADIKIQQTINMDINLNINQQQLEQVLSKFLLIKGLQKGILVPEKTNYISHFNFHLPCSLHMDCQE